MREEQSRRWRSNQKGTGSGARREGKGVGRGRILEKVVATSQSPLCFSTSFLCFPSFRRAPPPSFRGKGFRQLLSILLEISKETKKRPALPCIFSAIFSFLSFSSLALFLPRSFPSGPMPFLSPFLPFVQQLRFCSHNSLEKRRRKREQGQRSFFLFSKPKKERKNRLSLSS